MRLALWCLCKHSLEYTVSSLICVFWWFLLLVSVLSFLRRLRFWWYPANLSERMFLGYLFKKMWTDFLDINVCLQVSDPFRSTDIMLAASSRLPNHSKSITSLPLPGKVGTIFPVSSTSVWPILISFFLVYFNCLHLLKIDVETSYSCLLFLGWKSEVDLQS